MNREFIEKVYEELDSRLSYHSKEIVSKNGTMNKYHQEKLLVNSYLKRLLDSVFEPIYKYLPETNETIGE